jgi:uncharacterized protein (DUF1501 family)
MSEHECTSCPEYRSLSRRGFMQVTGGAAALVAAAAAAPSWLPRVALARSARSSMRDVVVQVYLRGGADGLTLFPPHGESAYYTSRPALSVPRPGSGLPNPAIDLDGFFGMSPALAPLLPAYQNGHMLVVHATGLTNSNRSHFDAQRYMEVAKVNDPTVGTGWLGRHLFRVDPMNPDALLRAVGIGSGLQKTLVGGPKTLPIPNLDTFGLTGSAGTVPGRSDALLDMYTAAGEPLQTIALNTLQTIDLLNTINFATYAPGGGAVYPTGSLGYALRTTAALIRAQVGVEAVAVDVNGWDTHNNQGNQPGGVLSNLMTSVANAVAAFYQDMVTGGGPNVIVLVISEFGRRARENASAGTDHGYGNALFMLGQCVRGGRVLSVWPGMGPGQLYENLDLAITIDYRDLLAEIVQSRLGNSDLAYVFPGFTPTLRGVVC